MKVDLVYLWCDGSDPVWRKNRESCLPEEEKRDAQTFCEGRIYNNDELKYSLRSVEMYAPWINHIFIITDNQCPEWLDRTNEKITIVDHKDIFPDDVLPLYNSSAIELNMHKIAGLSEYYLYSNDDMFFTRKVTRSFFFSDQGKAICRFSVMDMSKIQIENNVYNSIVLHANQAIAKDFGFNNALNWFPPHQIDPYVKSDVAICLDKYQVWHNDTLKNRFRTPVDMHRSIFSQYVVANGYAEAKTMKRYSMRSLKGIISLLLSFLRIKKQEYLSVDINSPFISFVIKMIRPYLLCLNDAEAANNTHRANAKKIIKKLFPKKSQFEL